MIRRIALARVLFGVVIGGVVLAGCTTLPESGAVHRVTEASPDQDQGPAYFQPPGPTKDSTPSQIVSDFLTAMSANPLTTSVAREFLTDRARAAWKPNRGTIVYEAPTVLAGPDGVRVRLADTQRLDSRGGWRGGTPGHSETIDFQLVSEDGQWRIDNPVNALIVPSSFFDRSFARFNLYFFDQTGRTLLPDPVFIPRGEQSATNLVRGLLAGPGSSLSDITLSALPRGTQLDLSVVVTESGVAEVPLSREALTMPRCRAGSRRRPARLDAAPGARHRTGADHRRRFAGPAAQRRAPTHPSPAAPSSTPRGRARRSCGACAAAASWTSTPTRSRSAARWGAPGTPCAAWP